MKLNWTGSSTGNAVDLPIVYKVFLLIGWISAFSGSNPFVATLRCSSDDKNDPGPIENSIFVN